MEVSKGGTLILQEKDYILKKDLRRNIMSDRMKDRWGEKQYKQ